MDNIYTEILHFIGMSEPMESRFRGMFLFYIGIPPLNDDVYTELLHFITPDVSPHFPPLLLDRFARPF